MSKVEYLTPRYISTSPKRKIRNNIDVIDYFAGDMSRPKSAAVKDIDIDIAITLSSLQKTDIPLWEQRWTMRFQILTAKILFNLLCL